MVIEKDWVAVIGGNDKAKLASELLWSAVICSLCPVYN